MSYAGQNDIRLTLTTAEGRIGWCWLSRPDDMSWDDEGDDETVSAAFVFIGFAGDEQQTHEIDGDDWRTLEDQDELDKVLYWVRRGIDLDEAIEAAMDGSDPGNVDGELHSDIDELVNTLRDIVRRANDEPFATRVRIGLGRAEVLLQCYAGRV